MCLAQGPQHSDAGEPHNYVLADDCMCSSPVCLACALILVQAWRANVETDFVCLLCCFMSQVISYVIARRSVHLTMLFPGQA